MTNNDTQSSDVNDKDVVDMNKGGEHSPLPWKYSEGFSNGNIGIVDEDGEWRILAEGDPENINAENDLKHIVHCVNNYPVLVEALKKIANTYPNYRRIGTVPRNIAQEALKKAGAL